MLTLSEVEAAIAFDQPDLRATQQRDMIVVEGTFVVTGGDAAYDPEGPLARYGVRIELSSAYPRIEPRVFETDGRIARDPDHHINGEGDCCVTVWENWLVTAGSTSFSAYLRGPLREYFLGQFWFENTGSWPFGERAHGMSGLEEAYAEALGIPNVRKDLLYLLRFLRQQRSKGHWPCPCGSGRRVRNCHQNDLSAQRQRIKPHIAKSMLARMQPRKGELSRSSF
ncbi:MAG TPA: hypothetical protein VGN68_16930 [Sphingopyxis sp.]|uniref:hypothetical protein n=1 Tax=Sphingopyxis sp. TaxID=1908224 RepID=UPI002E14067C|nr:hypothetical protein [Sphingopyxis sp.]